MIPQQALIARYQLTELACRTTLPVPAVNARLPLRHASTLHQDRIAPSHPTLAGQGFRLHFAPHNYTTAAFSLSLDGHRYPSCTCTFIASCFSPTTALRSSDYCTHVSLCSHCYQLVADCKACEHQIALARGARKDFVQARSVIHCHPRPQDMLHACIYISTVW